jgi:hypothetical protein
MVAVMIKTPLGETFGNKVEHNRGDGSRVVRPI